MSDTNCHGSSEEELNQGRYHREVTFAMDFERERQFLERQCMQMQSRLRNSTAWRCPASFRKPWNWKTRRVLGSPKSRHALRNPREPRDPYWLYWNMKEGKPHRCYPKGSWFLSAPRTEPCPVSLSLSHLCLLPDTTPIPIPGKEQLMSVK